MLNFTIQKDESESTLISFPKKRLATTPLSLIYKLFRTKKIKVNGENIRYYHYRLKKGDRVNIYDNSLIVSKPNFALVPFASFLDFTIVFEDKNLLLVVKDHGISMPELEKAARYYLYRQDPLKYQELTKNFFFFFCYSPARQIDLWLSYLSQKSFC